MLASVYTDDEERGKAIGIALGGLAMGVLGVYFWRLEVFGGFLDSIMFVKAQVLKPVV